MQSELSMPLSPHRVLSLLDDSDRRQYTRAEAIAMVPEKKWIKAAACQEHGWAEGKPDRATVLGLLADGYHFTEPSPMAKQKGYGLTFIIMHPTQRVYIET